MASSSRAASITSVLLLLLLLAAPSSSLVTLDLHGNVHPEGCFTLKIGEPARDYNLDVDTGSILTWVQCNVPPIKCSGGCRKVVGGIRSYIEHSYFAEIATALTTGYYQKWPQTHPYYELTAGKPVPRNWPLCQALHPLPSGDERNCPYRIDYLDGHSKGVLIQDKFTLPLRHGQQFFAFGCGFDQTWGQHQPPVDGILGLGRKGSSVSLISQLMQKQLITKDAISHCISKDGGGFLHIGDYQHSSSAVTWVRMNLNAGVGHYSPDVVAELHFESSEGALRSKHPISVVFNSGSTFSYFVARTYQWIETMATATLHKSFTKAVDDNTMPLCWKWNGPEKFRSIEEVKPFFKSIFLVFGKGNRKSVFEIAPENYLFISHPHKNVCFGILPPQPGWIRETNIIRAITMQDRIVMYDNDGRRIGWAHDSCKARPSGPVITSRL